MVAFRSPHRASAAGLDLTVVGMRAEANDAQLAILRRHGHAVDGGESGVRQTTKRKAKASRVPKAVEQVFCHGFVSEGFSPSRQQKTDVILVWHWLCSDPIGAMIDFGANFGETAGKLKCAYSQQCSCSRGLPLVWRIRHPMTTLPI